MNERFAEVETPSGRMETFVTHPEQDGPFPAVIIYMDIWGVREELFEIARRVGTVGYYCMLPDFYYREGRVRHQFRDAAEADDLAARSRPGAPAAHVRARPAAVRPWSSTTPARSSTSSVAASRCGRVAVGAIGYCMGGRHVLCLAGPTRARPGLGQSARHEPHQRPPTPASPGRPGSAASSTAASPKRIRTHRSRSCRRWPSCFAGPGRVSLRVHGGALHGYALPNRDIFHARARARDWELIFAMFHRRSRRTPHESRGWRAQELRTHPGLRRPARRRLARSVRVVAVPRRPSSTPCLAEVAGPLAAFLAR